MRETSGQATRWQERQITAATFSCNTFSSVLTDLKRLQFSSEVSAKEKSLSVNNSLFPSFLLMTDLAEALGAGEVEEPRKYELKCSYTSFP